MIGWVDGKGPYFSYELGVSILIALPLLLAALFIGLAVFVTLRKSWRGKPLRWILVVLLGLLGAGYLAVAGYRTAETLQLLPPKFASGMTINTTLVFVPVFSASCLLMIGALGLAVAVLLSKRLKGTVRKWVYFALLILLAAFCVVLVIWSGKPIFQSLSGQSVGAYYERMAVWLAQTLSGVDMVSD